MPEADVVAQVDADNHRILLKDDAPTGKLLGIRPGTRWGMVRTPSERIPVSYTLYLEEKVGSPMGNVWNPGGGVGPLPHSKVYLWAIRGILDYSDPPPHGALPSSVEGRHPPVLPRPPRPRPRDKFSHDREEIKSETF